MASPRLAGIRQPGLHMAGAAIGGAGAGGPSTANLITITDAGSFYVAGNVEDALQEVGTSLAANATAIALRPLTADLASTAAGKGASTIGTHDPSLWILGASPSVEASLVSIAADTDAAQTDATTALAETSTTRPIVTGGTGQTTAAAAFDALTVTAPALTSAATVDLSLAGCPGHYAIVNGATGPITSFGTAPAGTERILRFASTPTVHHDGVAIILPGAADITMAAGDVLFLHSLGLGNWRATSYTRAASLPAFVVDLAALTAGKGASLIGIQDAGGLITATTVEGAFAEVATNVATHTTAIALRPLTTDLASTAAAKGASTIGLQDAGGYYTTKTAEAALQQLGPLAAGVLALTTGKATFTLTGAVPGANNTASIEAVGVDFAMGRTSTWSTGALATQREVLVRKPTYAFGGASTLTSAATFAIEGPPVAGTNATITNRYSLWTLDGLVAHEFIEPNSGGSNTSVADVMVLRHSYPAGAPAVGWGLTLGMDLANTSQPTPVRAVNIQPRWTNASAGSENGVLAMQTRVSGGSTLLDQALFGTTSEYSGLNVSGTITNASSAAPHLTVGPSTSKMGMYKSGGFLCFANGGNQLTIASTTTFTFQCLASMTPPAAASGVATKFSLLPTTDTNTTASTEALDVDFDLSRTRTWATGALATQRAVRIKPPTYAFVGASTLTTAATLAIEGAPIMGANATALAFAAGSAGVATTFPTAYALWTQSGITRHDVTDGATNTVLEALTLRRTTSATAAAGIGAQFNVDIQAAGFVRRVMSDNTTLITATDGAEEAQREVKLMVGGSLVSAFSGGFIAGSPALKFGDPTSNVGFYRSGTTLVYFTGATNGFQFQTGGMLSQLQHTFNSFVTLLPGATGSGVSAKLALTPAADTGTTASTEAFDVNFDLSRTRTWATGALATQRAVRIKPPTYAFVGASTLTTAATLAIEGPPVAGTNATITNAYSMWTQAGTVRHDLADAATTTAPDGLVQRHSTSGTSAAGYGITNAFELQNDGSAHSGVGQNRRIGTDVTLLKVATDAAEEGRRDFALMVAGSSQPCVSFGFLLNGNNPMLYLGDATSSPIGVCRVPGASCIQAVYSNAQMQWDGNGSTSLTRHTFSSNIAHTPVATGSGVLTKFALTPGADTGTTASTEAFDVDFNLSRTRTWATGALATQRAMRIKGPTYAFVGASTITSTATLAIESAPAAGANATITNAYALWVQAGGARFDGSFGLSVPPVAQQNTTGTNAGFLAVGAGSGAVSDVSTFTGNTGATAYRISDVVRALKNYGLLAA